MSKNKPKETIEYVVRLQDKERELLGQLVDTTSFSRVATPIVDLLKDVTGMATVLSIIFFLFPKLFQNPATGEFYTLSEIRGAKDDGGIFDYIETQNLLAVSAGVAVGIATGGLGFIPVIIGTLAGTIVAEGAEEIVEDIQSATDSVKAYSQYQARLLLFVEQVSPGLLGGERLVV